MNVINNAIQFISIQCEFINLQGLTARVPIKKPAQKQKYNTKTAQTLHTQKKEN